MMHLMEVTTLTTILTTIYFTLKLEWLKVDEGGLFLVRGLVPLN